MHYLELSPALVKKLSIGGNKRVICTLAGTIRLHAAVMKTKEGMYYIMIGSKYLRQLQLGAGKQVKAANYNSRCRKNWRKSCAPILMRKWYLTALPPAINVV